MDVNPIPSSLASRACEFLSASPDAFHAVAKSVQKLEAAGFQQLRTRSPSWTSWLKRGGKYFYTINHSTLVAFTVGSKYNTNNQSNNSNSSSGFVILGGHTDSPNLKVKPISKKPPGAGGCIQLGVECYGGGLWHTWFDRDLGISGRVLVRNRTNNDDDDDKGSTIEQRLVNLRRPVARVSTLCIHLQSADERKAFTVNKETNMSPIVGTTTTTTTTSSHQTILEKELEGQLMLNGDLAERHESRLLQAIAEELNVSVNQMADVELNLYDVQPAAVGGLGPVPEFVFSARLDNLATVFCAVEALVDHSSDVSQDTDVCLIALFDHEEVGSQSAHGAGSPVMSEAVRRISSALAAVTEEEENNDDDAAAAVYKGTPSDLYASVVRNSFVLSVDQAHAVHPNYASKHESNHGPTLNGGVVIKTNSNQRYTTNGVTGFIVRELGRRANVPIQEFVVRNDCPCGSTIGPIISANTGIRTVDVGMPQLSMHSCREVMGIADLTHGLELFKAYFKEFRAIDDQLEG